MYFLKKKIYIYGMKYFYFFNLKKIIYACLSIFYCILVLQSKAQTHSSIDSAKRVISYYKSNNPNYIKTCFYISDFYVEEEVNDSAQIWLNKVHKILPFKKASVFTYLLSSRQAEVYYYNNLLQLGLQESNRALDIAEQLEDSFFIADSYNFRGLFFIGLDSLIEASSSLLNAAKYVQLPLNRGDYYNNLSKPHHVYNNLAETYYKRNLFDSSIFYSNLSLKEASKIKIQRGIAMANNSLADAFISKGLIDSAFQHYLISSKIAENNNQNDIVLLCYGGISKCYLDSNNFDLANKYAYDGFKYLLNNSSINVLFSKQFLEAAIKIFSKLNNKKMYNECINFRKKIEENISTKENKQLKTILNSSIENEKIFLNLEIQDAKRKGQLANTRLLMSLIGLAFLCIGFLVYRYFQNQKHQLQKIRQEISQDLHDDIGASLSSLQIYSTVATKSFKEQPDKTLDMLQKITTQSKQVMENMNDIVWSMNVNKTNPISLEAKVKNYSVELLSSIEINFVCKIDSEIEQQLKSITAKRNILLIIREALNNIAKYSKATNASLEIFLQNKKMTIQIKDDGIGFDVLHKKQGNGIYNMQKRVEELGGNFDLQAAQQKGATITITIPTKSL